MQDLVRVFQDNFRVEIGRSEAVKRAAYALRYQVYCLETGFESAERFPDGLEYDRYDQRSVHALVFYREQPLPAATVRLILPSEEDDFPIERHCIDSMTAARFDPRSLPRDRVAEISRFAVSKEFKRRLGERGTIAGGVADVVDPVPPVTLPSRRLLPHLTLGLFRAIVAMSAREGITHWYAVMEPALLRLLTRFGIHFQTIGGLVDYHGRRQPCVGRIDDVLAGIWQHCPDVWSLITDHGHYWPAPPSQRLRVMG